MTIVIHIHMIERLFSSSPNIESYQTHEESIYSDLELLLKAKANVIAVVSYEDKRIQGLVNQVAKELRRSWCFWNEIDGLSRFDLEKKI